jgi:hypothetical protein
MRRFLATTLALALVGPVLWALDPPKDKAKSDKAKSDKPSAAAKTYQSIIDEYEKAEERYNKALKDAQTPQDKQAAQSQRPNLQDYTQTLLDLAKQHPKDPVAEKALGWIVEKTAGNPRIQGAKEAADLLMAKYPKSEQLGPACVALANSFGAENNPAIEKKLRQIAEKNPHKEVRGQACFALAQLLHRQSEGVAPNKEKAAKDAENFLNLAIEKYGDVKTPQGTLGDRAKDALAEIKQFGYGHLMPDIQGEDADGKTFKLSDYLGKVVLLDFWGNW